MEFLAFCSRADGLSLRPFFDHSIGGLDLYWGISSGYLVDIHAYVVKTATDIGAVPVQMQVGAMPVRPKIRRLLFSSMPRPGLPP